MVSILFDLLYSWKINTASYKSWIFFVEIEKSTILRWFKKKFNSCVKKCAKIFFLQKISNKSVFL